MGAMKQHRRMAMLALASVFACAVSCWPLLPGGEANAASASPASAASANNNANLVSQIAARLGQAKGIRSKFTQTQTLAAMKQPLVSTGSLLFFRERGVIWQIDTPYKAIYVITDNGVHQLDANGHPAANANPRGARGAAEASKMMRAMLGGDLSALYSQFDVHADGTPARWHMLLTPNQPQLAQSIQSLDMSGGAYLHTLLIKLASGDAIALEFDDSAAVAELTPAEQTLFGVP